MKVFKTMAIGVFASSLLIGNVQAGSDEHSRGFSKMQGESGQNRQGEGGRKHFENRRQSSGGMGMGMGGGKQHRHSGGCHGGGGGHKDVPEMDGAGAGIALGLLAGLGAIRRERRRKPLVQDKA